MATPEEKSNARIQIIKGLPFPNLGWFNKQNIEDAMEYVPKDGDVVIASYPKTGTTWLQYIYMQIVSKATTFCSLDDAAFKTYPYIEMVGAAVVEALTGVRLYKHHLPYNMVQKNNMSKCIYIYRHPEDVIVSYYHMLNNLSPETPVGFDEFFNDFVSGNIAYGSYFKNVLSFYKHRNDSNLLMVSYEKLHSNIRPEILRIAKFLGEEYYMCLLEQEDILDKIIEHTSFEYMKKNLHLTHPENKEKGEVNFFRKGIVGDGKDVLSKKQRQGIKEAAEVLLAGTSILKEWYKDEKN